MILSFYNPSLSLLSHCGDDCDSISQVPLSTEFIHFIRMTGRKLEDMVWQKPGYFSPFFAASATTFGCSYISSRHQSLGSGNSSPSHGLCSWCKSLGCFNAFWLASRNFITCVTIFLNLFPLFKYLECYFPGCDLTGSTIFFQNFYY